MVVSVLAAGDTFQKYKQMFGAVEGAHVSHTVYYEVQKKAVIPATEEVFVARMKTALSCMQEKVLAGELCRVCEDTRHCQVLGCCHVDFPLCLCDSLGQQCGLVNVCIHGR